MGTTTPQPLKIVYGSLTIGTTAEDSYRIKDGTFEFKSERLQGQISFGCIVFGTSISNLHTRCAAFELAFRDRRKSLAISLDGTAQHTFTQSSDINKNSSSTCTQLGGDRAEKGLWSGFTREYSVAIDIDLPPPSGSNGRTEQAVHLRYKANRERIMTITAQYNSTSGVTALENYQADSTYYTDVLTYWSSGSVEWKLLSEKWESPDALLDVQITVTREYEEIIRKIRIDYGSLTLGTADPYRILDGWQFNRVRANRGRISFMVRVYAADASAMATSCNALEEGFAERRKTLKLYYNGVVQNDFTVSEIYTDSVGQSTSQEGEWFGLLTRDYRVEVEIDLPPKNTDGITEEDVKVTFTASRRLNVTIRARYNSILGTGAKALYTANFDTYCSGVLTAVGAGLSFNLISEDYNTLPVINNKIEITRVYEEILFAETDGVTDDAAIRGLDVTLKIGKNFPGDFVPSSSGGVVGQSQVPGSGSAPIKRLITLTIQASCPVEKATDIYTTYDTKLRNYLIQYAKTKSGAAMIAVVDESPSYNPAKNTIDFTITMQAALDGAGQVISSSQTISQKNNDGKLIVRVWDGTKYGAYEVDTKGRKIRSITEIKQVVQGNENYLDRIETMPLTKGTTSGRWVRMDIDDTIGIKTIGNIIGGAGESFKVVEMQTMSVFEWVTNPTSTQVSGGTGL